MDCASERNGIGFGGLSVRTLCGSVIVVSGTSFTAVFVKDVRKMCSNCPGFAQKLISPVGMSGLKPEGTSV